MIKSKKLGLLFLGLATTIGLSSCIDGAGASNLSLARWGNSSTLIFYIKNELQAGIPVNFTLNLSSSNNTAKCNIIYVDKNKNAITLNDEGMNTLISKITYPTAKDGIFSFTNPDDRKNAIEVNGCVVDSGTNTVNITLILTTDGYSPTTITREIDALSP